MLKLLATMGGAETGGEDDGSKEGGGHRIEIFGNPQTLNLEEGRGSLNVGDGDGESDSETETDDSHLQMLEEEEEEAPPKKKNPKFKKKKSKEVVADDEVEIISTLPSACSMSKHISSKPSEQLKVNKKITKQQKGKSKASAAATTAVDAISRSLEAEKSLKAEVWQHFNVTFLNKVRLSAHCKYCGVSVPCHSKKNGTSSARSHAASCSFNHNNDKCKMKQSVLGLSPAGLESNNGPSPYLGNWVFDCKAAREAFVKKMIIDQDAFCEFQKPGWQLLLAVILPPYFHLPGRHQFARDCLSMYDKRRK